MVVYDEMFVCRERATGGIEAPGDGVEQRLVGLGTAEQEAGATHVTQLRRRGKVPWLAE